MVEIELGKIKKVSGEMSSFLEEKLGIKVTVEGDTLIIPEGEEKGTVRTSLLKTYLKRFIYLKGMRKDYRIFVDRGTVRFSVRENESNIEAK